MSITDAINGTFVSKDGLFKIGLNIPFIDTSGVRFKEGEIRIGYFDYAWDRDVVSYDSFNNWCVNFDVETVKNIRGHLESTNVISNTDPFDSTTYFTFEDGRVGMERHVMRKKRLYVILAIVDKLLGQYLFQRVIDSFAPTGDFDSDSLLKDRMDLLTWRPFPQTPLIPGQRNDLIDDNLKGPVRKVTNVYRDKKGNRSGMQSSTEYDRRGYVTRRIEYDQYGKPGVIEYWGFLDGKRVMKAAAIIENYSLFEPRVVNKKPEDAPQSYDPKLGYDARYWQSELKRYQAGKLVEKIRYNNDGKILSRIVWEFNSGKVKRTSYASYGYQGITLLMQKFDERGNVIDEMDYSPPGPQASTPSHLLFQYEYDKYGNWTKRSHCIEYGGECPQNTGFSEYREISYY